jgi:hypothetical protein
METLPRPSEHVASERVGDELVLVHLQTNQVYALNETGMRVWELLATCDDSDELRGALEAEFDASSDEIAQTVAGVLDDLRAAQLVD